MYQWSDSKIAFMKDAYEYVGAHEAIAKMIAPVIDGADRICDAGCGLGYLSLALSKLCREVTAIDLDSAALSVLRENMKEYAVKTELRNAIKIVNEDVHFHKPKMLYDVMVFCFFGSVDEILKIAKRQCKREIVIIKRNHQNHRFKLEEKAIRGFTAQKAVNVLGELGIPFEQKPFSIEFGQPFRHLSEAIKFYETHAFKENTLYKSISSESVKSKLLEISEGDYRYYLPMKREAIMLTIKVDDIPDIKAHSA